MTRVVQELLHDVLALPEGDRLDIVAEVLAKLDGPVDPDWEATWLAELDRREVSESSQPSGDEDWPAVRARILTDSSRRGG